MEIEKKDWEELKRNAEMNLKQSMISTYQFQTLCDLCDTKLSEMESEIEKEVEDVLKDGAD